VIRDLVAGLAGAQDLVAIDDYGRAGDSHERHALGGKVHREAQDGHDDEDGPCAAGAPGSGGGVHTALIDWRSRSTRRLDGVAGPGELFEAFGLDWLAGQFTDAVGVNPSPATWRSGRAWAVLIIVTVLASRWTLPPRAWRS